MTAIAISTEQVHAARKAHARAKSRLDRRVVRDLDAVIGACEQLHLIGRERMTSALFGPTDGQMTVTEALANADAFLAGHGLRSPQPLVPISARSTIVHVLDAVYEVQEVVFDVLIPERRELTAEDEAWRFDKPSAVEGLW